MAALPEINYQIVAQKLSLKLSESIFQSTQLEVLAESIRDERDQLVQQVQELENNINELRSLKDLKETKTED